MGDSVASTKARVTLKEFGRWHAYWVLKSEYEMKAAEEQRNKGR